jgi:hypothetical protein
MHTPRSVLAAGLTVLLAHASGCATIVSGRHADVTFYSNVPDASVVIHDKRGEQVMVAQTQSKIALKRNDKYFLPARNTAKYYAPGYQPVEVPVRSKINPWVFGNVAVGGVAGLVVDSATGAAWMPKEATYYQRLTPMYGSPPGGPALFGAAGQFQQPVAGPSAGQRSPSLAPTEAGVQTAAATSAVPSAATHR